jgi:hypothetical protein
VDELEFDTPVFKQLAHNDSGEAKGHQGGIVIPKDLDPYFPQLSGKISPSNPTIDENIRAILVVGSKVVATVSTRYQFQSWSGARPPERRITGNLGPLRDMSAADDILLVERNLTDRSVYRMTLLKRFIEPDVLVARQCGAEIHLRDGIEPSRFQEWPRAPVVGFHHQFNERADNVGALRHDGGVPARAEEARYLSMAVATQRDQIAIPLAAEALVGRVVDLKRRFGVAQTAEGARKSKRTCAR